MRFVATLFLWIITTAALAVAVPTMWAQRNVVDLNGYSALAASAAKDPQLQEAMAGELGTQLKKMVNGTGYDVSADLLRGARAPTPPALSSPVSSRRPTALSINGYSPTPSSRPTRPGGGRLTCRRC